MRAADGDGGFALPGGASPDIVAISHNGLVVGPGEGFLAFLTAVAPRRPDGGAIPTRSSGFSASIPDRSNPFQDAQALPKSFATLAYSVTMPSVSWTALG